MTDNTQKAQGSEVGEALRWPPSESDLNGWVADIVALTWSPSTASYIRAGKLSPGDIKAKYAIREILRPYAEALATPARTDDAGLLMHNDDCEAMQRPRADCTCCPAPAPQPHTAPMPHEVAPQGRDEVERLREALRPFVEGATHTMVFLTSREKMHSCGVDLYREDVERARAALSPPLS